MKALRSNPTFLAICFVSILFAPYMFVQASAAEQLIGTYEVSYMYNSMSDGTKPVGSLFYNGILSEPIKLNLAPGSYYTKIVPGLLNDNIFWDDPNYSGDAADLYGPQYNRFVSSTGLPYNYPNTGYNGGHTDPSNNPDPLETWYMLAGWVGTTETDGSLYNQWALNDVHLFDIEPGESLWLYWRDSYILDNLGGVTVEVWQTASAPVPEPATMLLIGSGLIGLVGLRRKFKK